MALPTQHRSYVLVFNRSRATGGGGSGSGSGRVTSHLA